MVTFPFKLNFATGFSLAKGIKYKKTKLLKVWQATRTERWGPGLLGLWSVTSSPLSAWLWFEQVRPWGFTPEGRCYRAPAAFPRHLGISGKCALWSQHAPRRALKGLQLHLSIPCGQMSLATQHVKSSLGTLNQKIVALCCWVQSMKRTTEKLFNGPVSFPHHLQRVVPPCCLCDPIQC